MRTAKARRAKRRHTAVLITHFGSMFGTGVARMYISRRRKCTLSAGEPCDFRIANSSYCPSSFSRAYCQESRTGRWIFKYVNVTKTRAIRAGGCRTKLLRCDSYNLARTAEIDFWRTTVRRDLSLRSFRVPMTRSEKWFTEDWISVVVKRDWERWEVIKFSGVSKDDSYFKYLVSSSDGRRFTNKFSYFKINRSQIFSDIRSTRRSN